MSSGDRFAAGRLNCLSFNVHIVLAVGALRIGNADLSKQIFARARYHLFIFACYNNYFNVFPPLLKGNNWAAYLTLRIILWPWGCWLLLFIVDMKLRGRSGGAPTMSR